jgi:hypothetical protein
VNLKDIVEVSNVLVLPAFGYIVLLERRITQMQTQLNLLLTKLRGRAP